MGGVASKAGGLGLLTVGRAIGVGLKCELAGCFDRLVSKHPFGPHLAGSGNPQYFQLSLTLKTLPKNMPTPAFVVALFVSNWTFVMHYLQQ